MSALDSYRAHNDALASKHGTLAAELLKQALEYLRLAQSRAR